MKKVITMKEARKAAGKSLEEVAAACQISYSAARALEIGIGLNYSASIKHRVSDYFGVPFFSMWPEEHEKLGGIMKEMALADPEQESGPEPNHRLMMLNDYLPGLKVEDRKALLKILNVMSLEELDDLFESGVTRQKAISVIKKGAKRHGLQMPEIK